MQLQFNPPPTIIAYTPVTVQCGEDTATFGEKTFPNLLPAQLNTFVQAAEFMPDEALDIVFDDGSRIAVSLRPADYVGPEGINLFCKNEDLVAV